MSHFTAILIFVIFQYREHQQNSICSIFSPFVDLVGLQDNIFLQYGVLDGPTHLLKIRQVSSKIFLIGDNRYTLRKWLITIREFERIIILGEHTLTRAYFFTFKNSA